MLLGATAGRTQRTSRNKRYRVPEGVVEYIGQLTGSSDTVQRPYLASVFTNETAQSSISVSTEEETVVPSQTVSVTNAVGCT